MVKNHDVLEDGRKSIYPFASKSNLDHSNMLFGQDLKAGLGDQSPSIKILYKIFNS